VCPNTGFWEQLKIWEECGYEVWEEVDGKRIEKEVYKTWKKNAEEKMRQRIAAETGTWRDAGLKRVALKKTVEAEVVTVIKKSENPHGAWTVLFYHYLR
jgi:hypothetical protein